MYKSNRNAKSKHETCKHKSKTNIKHTKPNPTVTNHIISTPNKTQNNNKPKYQQSKHSNQTHKPTKPAHLQITNNKHHTKTTKPQLLKTNTIKPNIKHFKLKQYTNKKQNNKPNIKTQQKTQNKYLPQNKHNIKPTLNTINIHINNIPKTQQIKQNHQTNKQPKHN